MYSTHTCRSLDAGRFGATARYAVYSRQITCSTSDSSHKCCPTLWASPWRHTDSPEWLDEVCISAWTDAKGYVSRPVCCERYVAVWPESHRSPARRLSFASSLGHVR
ncbi:hypothetical protein MAPG_01780 [Magnaporthiopsis poae ATCC 64411]|uniref:Uncharacterized protein n=1 Tax=Magnaporthiopsis poae (strain ATCC 64411 / 73-15) TaxID=644358 RepID=A0A0C4DPL1_MAGP6|nr:hypothetical protein MAPG_01780 [Magnaporthiopsis poae ATCC 64411]